MRAPGLDVEVGTTSFRLPNITSLLTSAEFSFPHAPINSHHTRVSVESADWFASHVAGQHERDAFQECNASLLATRCYPRAEYAQMRVLCDWMNWTFYADNVTDEMGAEETERMAREMLGVLAELTSGIEPDTVVGTMTKE